MSLARDRYPYVNGLAAIQGNLAQGLKDYLGGD